MAKKDLDGPPPSVLAFAAHLSPRAQRAIRAWGWTLDEGMRCSHEEFRRRLAQQGFPEWPFLWPLEEAFGGVEGMGVEFGIADMLTDHSAKDMIDESTGDPVSY